MAKLYVVGHGGFQGGGAVFVPTGKVVHSYAKEGEQFSAVDAQLILNAGGSENGLQMIKAGKKILNWTLYPDNSAELQRDLTAKASKMDGDVFFVENELPLCTTPDACRPGWLAWLSEVREQKSDAPGPVYHADQCSGLFKRFEQYREIHLLVCQSFGGVDEADIRTGVPRIVRDATGAAVLDRHGDPVVQSDNTKQRSLTAKAQKLLDRGRRDPVRTLMYVQNVVSQEELANLRSANVAFNDWLDSTWDYFQKLAPWDYKHEPKAKESKVEQYYNDRSKPLYPGWLTPQLRKLFQGKTSPASFEDCMTSDWDEVFFKWFYSEFLKDGANHLYEWVFFLWDLSSRYARQEVTAEHVLEHCQVHNVATIVDNAKTLISNLSEATQRKAVASAGGVTADDQTRLDGGPSVAECMDEILGATSYWMSEIYEPDFIAALETEGLT